MHEILPAFLRRKHFDIRALHSSQTPRIRRYSASEERSDEPNKKTAGRRSLYSRFDFGQAATAALERRRYVMKPMPAKPRIIMPQVDGSATAATVSKVVVEKRPFPSTNSNVAELANRSVPKKKSSACSPGPIVSGLIESFSLPSENFGISGKVA